MMQDDQGHKSPKDQYNTFNLAQYNPEVDCSKIKQAQFQYSKELRMALKVDSVLIKQYMTTISHKTVEELVHRLQTQKVSILEATLIKGFLRAYVSGDTNQLNFFIERLAGKVPDIVETRNSNIYEEMSVEELQQLKEALEIDNRRTLDFLEQYNPRTEKINTQLEEYISKHGDETMPIKTNPPKKVRD